MVDAVVRAIDRAPRVRVAISHVEAKETAAQLASMFQTKLGHAPAFLSVNEASLTDRGPYRPEPSACSRSFRQ